MLGVLGLTLIGAEFGDEDRAAMSREIALYKSIRSAVGPPLLLLLTAQADRSASGGWDVVQWSSPHSGASVVFAFAGPGAESGTTVHLKGLSGDAQYVVTSSRGHQLMRATGAALMQDGLVLRRLPFTSGYVLQLAWDPVPPTLP